MHIHLIAVGRQMPPWVDEAFAEYQKRFPPQFQLSLHEVAAGHRGKGADLARIVAEEGRRTLAKVPHGSAIIALDQGGRVQTSEILARNLDRFKLESRDVALLIGGPEGLAPACLQAAEEKWSLSSLTLAHPVVRVVVAEQLYRAWSILKGLPYHR
ncbi:MAG: 23S rRNA (pseudouridine(1915)-N(3))-methyltransferase RlmH [Gammaproteobacteria bacterium]|nr:MAG: 23S rRNA (pseudouridine(1915)-N(3))-methyltransferase RlmH [Gammaproteobacteria bacterium]